LFMMFTKISMHTFQIEYKFFKYNSNFQIIEFFLIKDMNALFIYLFS